MYIFWLFEEEKWVFVLFRFSSSYYEYKLVKCDIVIKIVLLEVFMNFVSRNYLYINYIFIIYFFWYIVSCIDLIF